MSSLEEASLTAWLQSQHHWMIAASQVVMPQQGQVHLGEEEGL